MFSLGLCNAAVTFFPILSSFFKRSLGAKRSRKLEDRSSANFRGGRHVGVDVPGSVKGRCHDNQHSATVR